MTAFNTNDIPPNVDTLEKLAVWLGLALASINPQTTAIEAPNYTARVCQVGTFLIESDNKYRSIIRLSIPLSASHLAGANNAWTYAEEISQTALDNAFKVAA